MNIFDLQTLEVESAGVDGDFDLLKSSVSFFRCF